MTATMIVPIPSAVRASAITHPLPLTGRLKRAFERRAAVP
jgi:hypothetical protein